jgi:hypothetical protein
VPPGDLSRPGFRADPESLLERRVPLILGATIAWTLDPVDALVHTCHHAAFDSAKRLVQVLDCAQLVRRVDDWDVVAERVADWRAEPQSAVVLGRARRLLGAPVPEDVGERLGVPKSFDQLLGGVDRLLPVSRARERASIAGMVAKAARPWTARTIGATVGGGAREVVRRLRRPDENERIPADRQAVADYLAAVERVGRTASPHR